MAAIQVSKPNSARRYKPFGIVIDDRQAVWGIIARETADAIYLVNTSRVETRVPRSAIETVARSNVSIMPEGMHEQLSRQELSDLIEFLHSLQ